MPKSRFLNRVHHRLVEEYRARTTRLLRAPSYTYKHYEAGRVRRLMRELGTEDPAFAINAKDDAHAWAQRLGVRTPRLLGTWPDARQIPWDDLPDRCVVKPCRGSTSTGVYLLHRRADGWRDLYTGRDLSQETVARELVELAARGAVSAAVLAEELVTDPRCPDRAPIDYKVHTFFGEVGMIEAKAHGWDGHGRATSTWAAFDPQWRNLDNPYNERNGDASIPPPAHREELLGLARRISAAVPRPFLRVDLYDDTHGPVFGELTPEPGGELFMRADVDRRLGQLWEDAEARLRTRVVRAGLLTPGEAAYPEAALGRAPAAGEATAPSAGRREGTEQDV